MGNNNPSNVIQLHNYRQTKSRPQESDPVLSGAAEVTDISVRRKAMIKTERRNVKRTILSEFIGVLVLVPGQGLQKCILRDISEDGLSFDMEARWGSFACDEQITMRVYLNHRTYFSFELQVENIRAEEGDAIYRHGGRFIPDSYNQEALYHFIRFIETVSTNLQGDKGDVLVASSGENS